MQAGDSFFEELSKKEGKKYKSKFRIFAFIICLVLSFLLWLVLSLSQTQTIHLSYPVTIINFPNNFILTEQSERAITFQAQATTQAIELFNKNGKNKHIVIDLKGLKPKLQGGRYQIAIQTTTYLQDFSNEMNFSGSIDHVTPDSMIFYFKPSQRKLIPVQLNAQYSMPEQYKEYRKAVISPDSVYVNGEKETLDTFSFIKTAWMNLGELREPVTKTFSLENYPNLHFSSDSVSVTIYVTEYTEKQLIVPLSVFSEDSSVTIKLLPNQVTVNCMVPINQFTDLTPDMFVVEAIYNQDTKEYGNRLPVNAVKVPEYVQITRITPDNVNYILIDNN